MKVRLQDQSVRLRVTRSEFEDLRTGKGIFMETVFPNQRPLSWSVASHGEPQEEITMENGCVMIKVSPEALTAWVQNPSRALTFSSNGPKGLSLSISLELDFENPRRRSGEATVADHL